MTREEKIEAIYKEMANKELALGCKARIYYTNYPNLADKYFWEITKYIEVVSMGNSHFEDGQIVKYKDLQHSFLKEDCYGFEVFNPIILQNYRDCFFKVIGHPVMIGDVLYWFENKYKVSVSVGHIEKADDMIAKEDYYIDKSIAKSLNLRNEMKNPIEDQSDECIDYVYSLIQKD